MKLRNVILLWSKLSIYYIKMEVYQKILWWLSIKQEFDDNLGVCMLNLQVA